MTKKLISATLDEKVIDAVDKKAVTESRPRSSMINAILKKELCSDDD